MRALRALLLLPAGLLLVACEDLAARGPGERLWRAKCADCHGIDGAGNTPRYMSDPWADLTDDRWKGYGGDRSALEMTIREGSGADMPAFAELSGEEMSALLDHLAKLRGETP